MKLEEILILIVLFNVFLSLLLVVFLSSMRQELSSFEERIKKDIYYSQDNINKEVLSIKQTLEQWELDE